MRAIPRPVHTPLGSSLSHPWSVSVCSELSYPYQMPPRIHRIAVNLDDLVYIASDQFSLDWTPDCHHFIE
jgi:hypothetical protein